MWKTGHLGAVSNGFRSWEGRSTEAAEPLVPNHALLPG